MGTQKPLSVLALGVFLIQATGCYSLYPLSKELPSESEGPVTWRTVVVTQDTGQRVEVREPWMDAVWIGGEAELVYPEGPRVTEVRFSLEEVRGIEEKRFSRAKTIVLVGGAIGFSALLPLAFADFFRGKSPGPGPEW